MKKTVKITVLIAVVLTTVLLAMTAWSQGGQQRGRGGQGGPGRPGGPGMMQGGPNSCPAMAIVLPTPMMIDRMAEPLGLTQDQVTKIKEVVIKAEETMPTLIKTSGDATKAFRTALIDAAYDEKKVKELVTAAQKAESALLTARIDNWTKIRAIVTADQAKRLLERPMMRPNPGRPGGPPPNGEQGGPPPGGPDGPPPPDGEGGPPPPPFGD